MNSNNINQINNQRYVFLDYSKAVAILFVILSHTHNLLPLSNFKSNCLYMIIEAFHVPTFYFISGLLFYGTLLRHDMKSIIIKKFFNSIIPFVFWGIINGLFRYIFFNSEHRGGGFLIGLYNYWFFPVLFLGYFLICIIKHFRIKGYIVHLLFLVVIFIVSFSSALMRLLFFPYLMYIGYTMSETNLFSQKEYILPVKIFMLCIFLYVSCSILLLINGYNGTYKGANGFIGALGFLNLISGSMIIPLGIKLVTTRITNFIEFRLFEFIGRNTLYMYILHYFIMIPLVSCIKKSYSGFLLSYLTVLAGTMLLVFFIKKIKFFDIVIRPCK